MSQEMIRKKTWEEFREAGLFWFVNRFLHVFGWVLVWETDEDLSPSSMSAVYPARTRFRGFSQDVEEEGFRKVTRWVREHSEDLLIEAEE